MTTSERFLEIQELFNAALRLPPSERQAFLNTQRLKDESIRKEVETLLAEDANPSGFLHDDVEETRSFGLSIGTRFGSYEVTASIGAGGMGEVYRARDSKLQRDVALKVLPASFAIDQERIRRFHREAQLLAALNHPHIAAVYGLEESNGVVALVMELVGGVTLAERMAAGPIPLEEALAIAKQIAEAFEAAHERGIIHRDLKPENVKITPEGAVKVLDFGLGKDLKADGSAGGAGSPAIATRRGIILGTAPYMSPEQARGAVVDTRTDIWTFGVVLYEMLTGGRPFTGDTTSDTMAAVLTQEPDWNRIPVKAQRLVRRCLEKDRKRRLHDIADAWALLDEEPQILPAKVRRRRISAAIAAGVFVVALAIGLWILWRVQRPAQTALRPMARLDVDLGSDLPTGSVAGSDVIISPDGSRLVYVSQSRLFTRRLDQPIATELSGTEGVRAPFFSPDAEWVGFFAQGKLKKISLQGGPAIVLCDARYGDGGSWGENGDIIASFGANLFRISSSGGVPEPLTVVKGATAHRWPQVLKGGRAALFGVYPSTVGVDDATIDVLSLDDHRRKTILQGAAWARYSPTGHLIYVNHGTLFAVPFDVDRLEVRGTPAPVLEGVAYSTLTGAAQVDFSRAGTLVYQSGGRAGGLVRVQWVDGAAKSSPLQITPGYYLDPRVSPDGNRLALTSAGEVWVYDIGRETMTQLTFGGGYANPLWSSDGRYIIFQSLTGMFWIQADGASKPQTLTQTESDQHPWSISADGKRMAFVEKAADSGADIWTMPIESNAAGLRAGKPEVFLHTSFNERAPAFSPDGRWLAYASDESGTLQVYVRAFPEGSGKIQISSGGGNLPVWARNGRDLFFMNPDNRLMRATYTAQGYSFRPDKPRLWHDKRLPHVPSTRSYDVAPDGKRIVALLPVDSAKEDRTHHDVTFLLNFFDELAPSRGKPASDARPKFIYLVFSTT